MVAKMLLIIVDTLAAKDIVFVLTALIYANFIDILFCMFLAF